MTNDTDNRPSMMEALERVMSYVYDSCAKKHRVSEFASKVRMQSEQNEQNAQKHIEICDILW